MKLVLTFRLAELERPEDLEEKDIKSIERYVGCCMTVVVDCQRMPKIPFHKKKSYK